MWSVWSAFELGVELAPDHEWVVLHLDDLHQFPVRRCSRNDESICLQFFAEIIIELVAMTMPFGNLP